MTFVAERALLHWLVTVGILVAPASALAVTIWSGPQIAFTKPAFADPSLEANQDRLTDSVWLTRASGQGIYNAQSEASYSADVSPSDTEWAWDLDGFNIGLEIAASNYQSLDFNPWSIAHGGFGGGPPSTVGIPGVLHLISDDIYIDIMFSGWSMTPESGASFSYVRTTAPPVRLPEPGTAILITFGLCALGVPRRHEITS